MACAKALIRRLMPQSERRAGISTAGREVRSDEEQHENRARKAAEAIARDIQDRSGGGGWWDSIDEDIQEEILDKWAGIILAEGP